VVSIGGGATGIRLLPAQSPALYPRRPNSRARSEPFADPMKHRGQAPPRCPAQRVGPAEIGFRRPSGSDAPTSAAPIALMRSAEGLRFSCGLPPPTERMMQVMVRQATTGVGLPRVEAQRQDR
jgi:hypothetical protein